jgi:membrane protease YdiL (CAAX protease family)
LFVALSIVQPPVGRDISLPTGQELLRETQFEALPLAESTDEFFQNILISLPIDVLAILFILLALGIVINLVQKLPNRTVSPKIRLFWTGLAGAFLWLIAGFAGGIWLSGVLSDWGLGSFGIHWITGFSLQFTFLVSVLALLVLRPTSCDATLFLDDRGTASALWIGVLEYLRFYPFLVLAIVVNELLVLPYTSPELPLSYRFLGSAQGSFQNVALYGLIGLLAPITEEFFFRGIVFGSLRSIMPVWPSVLVAGGVFGFIHFEYQLVLPLWLFGTYLCYAYERTSSIKVVIVMHFLQNTVSFYMIKRLFT